MLVPSRLEPRSSCSIYTSPNRFLPKPPIQPEDVHTLIYHRRLFVGRHVVVLRWCILRDGWTKGSSASCGRNIRTLSSSYSRSTRFFSSSLAANAARNAASADAAAPTATTMESPFPPPSPVCCIGVRAAETSGTPIRGLAVGQAGLRLPSLRPRAPVRFVVLGLRLARRGRPYPRACAVPSVRRAQDL